MTEASSVSVEWFGLLSQCVKDAEKRNEKYIMISRDKTKQGAKQGSKEFSKIVFKNKNEAYLKLEKLTETEHNLYEVVRNERVLYFDIDGKRSDYLNKSNSEIIDDFKIALSEFLKTYQYNISGKVMKLFAKETNYATTHKDKVSIHITARFYEKDGTEYYFQDVSDEKDFGNNFSIYLSSSDSTKHLTIDTSIYSTNRCLRLLNCSKLGRNSIMRTVDGYTGEFKYFCSNYIISENGIPIEAHTERKIHKPNDTKDKKINENNIPETKTRESDLSEAVMISCGSDIPTLLDNLSKHPFIIRHKIFEDYSPAKPTRQKFRVKGEEKNCIKIDLIRNTVGEIYCPICKRSHGHPDSRASNKYISISNSGTTYLHCYRNIVGVAKKSDNHGVCIFKRKSQDNIDIDIRIDKPLNINKSSASITDKTKVVLGSQIDYPDSVRYCRDFTDGKNEIVKSALGSGKSTAMFKFINSIIDEYKSRGYDYENLPSMLITTPRRSFAAQIKKTSLEKCPMINFKLYLDRPKLYKKEYSDGVLSPEDVENVNVENNDDTAEYNGGSEFKSKKFMKLSDYKFIICQMESLHRLRDSYDYVFMDESESCLFQATSITTQRDNILINNNKLLSILTSPNLKCYKMLDAFITNKSIDFANSLGRPYLFHNYSFKGIPRNIRLIKFNGPDPNLNLSKNMFLDLLVEKLKDGKNVFVVFTSIDKMNKWALVRILNEIPTIRHVEYSSKNKALSDTVNDEWVKYQLVMTTTSITVGCNFDRPYFDYVFIYASAPSRNLPRDIIQAHMRVRQTSNENIMVFIDGNPRTLGHFVPCSSKEIALHLDMKIGMLEEESAVYLSSPDIFKHLYIDNIHEQNVGLVQFEPILKMLFKECGYKIYYRVNDEEEIEEFEQDIVDIPYDKIPRISKEDFDKLEKKVKSFELLTELERAARSKYYYLSLIDKSKVPREGDDNKDLLWHQTKPVKDHWDFYNTKGGSRKFKFIRYIKGMRLDNYTFDDLKREQGGSSMYSDTFAPELRVVNRLLDVFNMKTQQDQKEIEFKEMERHMNELNEIAKDVKTLFGIERRIMKKKETELEKMRYVMKHLLECVGFSTIKNGKRKGSGKTGKFVDSLLIVPKEMNKVEFDSSIITPKQKPTCRSTETVRKMKKLKEKLEAYSDKEKDSKTVS